MPADWKALARAAGHTVTGDEITVRFENGRKHGVTVDDSPEGALRLWAVILPPAKTRDLIAGDPLSYAWQRNRLSDLVGFGVDSRGRLVAEAWAPLDGLTSAELDTYLREVARVSEYHEMRLAGVDEN